jgi:hypothetical protein
MEGNMRLIDADALINTIAIIAKKFAKTDAQKALMGRVIYHLERKSECIVRCKDCKNVKMLVDIIGKPHLFCCNGRSINRMKVELDDYCSYGERKEK